MKVNYLCPFAQPNGVARAAQDYCMSLLEAGVDLRIIPMFECDTDDLEPHYEPLAAITTPGWPKDTADDIWIVHAMPSDVRDIQLYMPECRAKICVTTWETSRLPTTLAGPLSEVFDLVLMPSAYAKAATVEADMDVRVEVLPHAIGPLWGETRNWNYGSDEPYAFYSIGAWGERKNLLGLLKAYLTEFTIRENVELYLKTNQVDKATLEALKLGTNLREFPAVSFDDSWLTEAELLEFHQACDCYVTATRGEGFGLGAFEACALGAPVIAPGEGGQVEFLSSYKGQKHLVRTFRTPAIWTASISAKTIAMGGQVMKLKAIESIAPKGVDATQHWLEPDLAMLQTRMRHLFESRAGRDPTDETWGADRVCQARADFLKRYSYASIGAEFRRLLEAL